MYLFQKEQRDYVSTTAASEQNIPFSAVTQQLADLCTPGMSLLPYGLQKEIIYKGIKCIIAN